MLSSPILRFVDKQLPAAFSPVFPGLQLLQHTLLLLLEILLPRERGGIRTCVKQRLRLLENLHVLDSTLLRQVRLLGVLPFARLLQRLRLLLLLRLRLRRLLITSPSQGSSPTFVLLLGLLVSLS
mmetsp:Transcript_1115/g.1821  ORF Transcript_1115/g.1821 Transcript_1115/m.1821 type:complete len:125 (+) Transcript_1115:592-966(+)